MVVIWIEQDRKGRGVKREKEREREREIERERERERDLCPPFQGKVALCACNHRFVTISTSNRLMAISEKAKEKEILTVR